MPLTTAEWALLASLLANVVTVVGWAYNRNQAAELGRELASTHRSHEKADRDLADFRRRLQHVAPVTSALHDQYSNFLRMSLICNPENFSRADYDTLYGSINDKWRQLDDLRNHPEYLSALNYLQARLRAEFVRLFSKLDSAHRSFAESAKDESVPAGLETMSRAAYDVAINCGSLSKIVSATFSWIDGELAGRSTILEPA